MWSRVHRIASTSQQYRLSTFEPTQHSQIFARARIYSYHVRGATPVILARMLSTSSLNKPHKNSDWKLFLSVFFFYSNVAFIRRRFVGFHACHMCDWSMSGKPLSTSSFVVRGCKINNFHRHLTDNQFIFIGAMQKRWWISTRFFQGRVQNSHHPTYRRFSGQYSRKNPWKN